MGTLNTVVLNSIKEAVAYKMSTDVALEHILSEIAKARKIDSSLRLSDAPLEGVAENLFPEVDQDSFGLIKFELTGSVKCLASLEIPFNSGDVGFNGLVIYGEPGTGKTSLVDLIKLSMVGGASPKKVVVDGVPREPFKKVVMRTTHGDSTNTTPLYPSFGTAFISEDIELQTVTREALKKLATASAHKDFLEITKALTTLKTGCNKMLAGFEVSEQVRARYDKTVMGMVGVHNDDFKRMNDIGCVVSRSIDACSKAIGEATAHTSAPTLGSYGVLLSAKSVSGHPDWLTNITKHVDSILEFIMGDSFRSIDFNYAPREGSTTYPSFNVAIVTNDAGMVGWYYNGFKEAVLTLGNILKSISAAPSDASSIGGELVSEDGALVKLRTIDSYCDVVMNRMAWGEDSEKCFVCGQQLEHDSVSRVDDMFARATMSKSKLTKTVSEMVSLLELIGGFLDVVSKAGVHAIKMDDSVRRDWSMRDEVYDITFGRDAESVTKRADLHVILAVLESISDAIGLKVNGVVSSMVDIVNEILREEFSDLPLVKRGVVLINSMTIEDVPTYGIIICDPTGNRIASSQISTGESAVIRALLQIAAVSVINGNSFICVDGSFNPVPDNYVVKLVDCLAHKMKFKNIVVTTNRSWVQTTLKYKFKTFSPVYLPL